MGFVPKKNLKKSVIIFPLIDLNIKLKKLKKFDLNITAIKLEKLVYDLGGYVSVKYTYI